jgi:ABC-type nitrate/sulfonate/bicarbonate transport system substrate-binding protein
MVGSTTFIRGALSVIAIVLGVMAGTPAQAQPEKSKVVIGYGSQSGAFGSFWIAADKGYFK